MNINRFLAALAIPAILFAGCGKKDGAATLYKVKGKLTIGGKAVQGIIVTFHPTDGIPSTGTTDENGEFTLKSQKGPEGAVAGKHKVVLSLDAGEAAYKSGGDPSNSKTPFPKEYSDAKTSPKEVTVEENDDNDIKIEI